MDKSVKYMYYVIVECNGEVYRINQEQNDGQGYGMCTLLSLSSFVYSLNI